MSEFKTLVSNLKAIFQDNDKIKIQKKKRMVSRSIGGYRKAEFFVTFQTACKYDVYKRVCQTLHCKRFLIANEYGECSSNLSVKYAKLCKPYWNFCLDKDKIVCQTAKYVNIEGKRIRVLINDPAMPVTFPFMSNLDDQELMGVESSSYIYSHCHAYISLYQKQKLLIFKNYLEEVGLPVVDIQCVRSSRDCIHYISKYDACAIMYGIRGKELSQSFHIKRGIRSSSVWDENADWLSKIALNYHKIVKNKHAEYWNPLLQIEVKGLMSPSKNVLLVRLLRQLKKTSKKRGFSIVGRSGFGKTSSVVQVLSDPYCIFKADSNFPMTSYNGEKDMFWDDATVDHFIRQRTLILQLARGGVSTAEVKGGGIRVISMKGYFYATSNDYLCSSSYLPFHNRFHVINVDDDITEETLFLLLNVQTVTAYDCGFE